MPPELVGLGHDGFHEAAQVGVGAAPHELKDPGPDEAPLKVAGGGLSNAINRFDNRFAQQGESPPFACGRRR